MAPFHIPLMNRTGNFPHPLSERLTLSRATPLQLLNIYWSDRFPNLRSFTTFGVCLELMVPFPPRRLPGFPRTTNLVPTQGCPTCPSGASGWSYADHALGFPCCRALFLVYMPPPLPRAASERIASPCIHPDVSVSRRVGRSNLRCPFRGLLGVHCVAACPLALVTNLCHANRRLQHFVYLHDCLRLIPAGAVAGGACTTGKRRLCTCTPEADIYLSGQIGHVISRLPAVSNVL